MDGIGAAASMRAGLPVSGRVPEPLREGPDRFVADGHDHDARIGMTPGGQDAGERIVQQPLGPHKRRIEQGNKDDERGAKSADDGAGANHIGSLSSKFEVRMKN